MILRPEQFAELVSRMEDDADNHCEDDIWNLIDTIKYLAKELHRRDG